MASVLTGFSRLHLEGTTRRLFMTEDDSAYPSFKQVQERLEAGAYISLKQVIGDLRSMVSCQPKSGVVLVLDLKRCRSLLGP